MQVTTAIFQNQGNLQAANSQADSKTNPGLMARLFGCRHSEMSRPFSIQGQAYRSCVACGARRQFNVDSWKMQGDYYYGLPNRVFAGTTR
ncbi:MAG TPA: hypothetical protein VJU86_01030 [Pyrinomonadaceae bacterium]|nr:hypothetical protein [Pyrinomonadaceae bacterium]